MEGIFLAATLEGANPASDVLLQKRGHRHGILQKGGHPPGGRPRQRQRSNHSNLKIYIQISFVIDSKHERIPTERQPAEKTKKERSIPKLQDSMEKISSTTTPYLIKRDSG